MAAAALHELGRNAEIGERFADGGAIVARMLAQGINSPHTSSLGRFFDAAAGLLGLCHRMQYEAQAAMLLEQAATRHIERHGWPQVFTDSWRIGADGQLDLLPLLAALIDAADVDLAAARFHATLVAALAGWVLQAAHARGVKTLTWGGGCFLNSLLSLGLREILLQRGMKVLVPIRLSPGDSSIAVGQAWVALNSLEQ
jgi:hydrogenase maturation protein HypF